MEKLPAVSSVSDPITQNPTESLEKVAGSLPESERTAVEDLAKVIPSPIAEDGRIAYSTVTYDRSAVDLMERFPVDSEKDPSDYTNPWSQMDRALAETRAAGVSTAIGGPVADTWNNPVSWWANHADEVGLGIGAILLLLAFGSLWGMAIPISTALFGAVTASGLVYLLASFTTVSSAAPPVTLMISLGVGLDYSLLIVTRYRQFISEGHEPHDAVGYALQTSGRASIFAGITVCIALLGLLVVPIPLVRTLGLSAAIGVAVMVLAACTLLPALLGFAGRRIDALGLPKRHHEEATPTTASGDASPTAMSGAPVDRACWPAARCCCCWRCRSSASVSACPTTDRMPASLSQRQAYDLMDEGFGPGINAPLVVAVAIDDKDTPNYLTALEQLGPVNTALGARAGIGNGQGHRLRPSAPSRTRSTPRAR